MLGCLLQKRRLWPCLCMGKEEATNPMHVGGKDSWARDLDTHQKQPGSRAWEKLGAAREPFAGVELKRTEAWGRGQESRAQHCRPVGDGHAKKKERPYKRVGKSVRWVLRLA